MNENENENEKMRINENREGVTGVLGSIHVSHKEFVS